jgi:acyl-CoA synthetase (AMP-forming)/AMP-acid ligase II
MGDSGPGTIGDLLFEGGQDPASPAIECPGDLPLTYRDLRLQVTSVVKTLAARGFGRNDRIGVILPPGPEIAVAIVCVMAGFTCVPLNPQHREQEYAKLFSRLGLKAVILQEEYGTAARPAAMLHHIPVIGLIPSPGRAGVFALGSSGVTGTGEAVYSRPPDSAIVLLTSGTTAEQKILPVSQRNLCSARQRQNERLGISRADRCLHLVPWYHGMGIGLPLLSPLLVGGTVICPRDFIAADFFPLLKNLRPTYYTAGPALHQAIIRELQKLPPPELKNNSLRFVLSSSLMLPAGVPGELQALLGVPVIDYYASSETGIISINFPPREGSVGIPVVESLKILDEPGSVLGPGEEGEVVVRGDTVVAGGGGGCGDTGDWDCWCRTGDLGYLDKDGYLFLTGRKKELINKGGEKISPAEIDGILKQHPGVLDAMSFGIADPVLGEEIGALVVPATAGLTEPALRQFLLDRLIPFKIPGRIWFVEAIQKTATGKPLRQEAARRYGGERALRHR